MMTKTEIEQIVNQFMVDDLEIDEELLKPDARLKEDLKIDSLDYVDIVVLVDQYFGFKIKLEEIREVKVLSQFYDYIATKVSNQK